MKEVLLPYILVTYEAPALKQLADELSKQQKQPLKTDLPQNLYIQPSANPITHSQQRLLPVKLSLRYNQLVMPWQGVPICSLSFGEDGLPLRSFVHSFLQLINSHCFGICHRDISPPNILFYSQRFAQLEQDRSTFKYPSITTAPGMHLAASRVHIPPLSTPAPGIHLAASSVNIPQVSPPPLNMFSSFIKTSPFSSASVPQLEPPNNAIHVRGIENLGATCYANSTFQCLFNCTHTPLSPQPPSPDAIDNAVFSDRLAPLLTLFYEYYHRNNTSFDNLLVRCLLNHFTLSTAVEQDPSEFLIYLFTVSVCSSLWYYLLILFLPLSRRTLHLPRLSLTFYLRLNLPSHASSPASTAPMKASHLTRVTFCTFFLSPHFVSISSSPPSLHHNYPSLKYLIPKQTHSRQSLRNFIARLSNCLSTISRSVSVILFPIPPYPSHTILSSSDPVLHAHYLLL